MMFIEISNIVCTKILLPGGAAVAQSPVSVFLDIIVVTRMAKRETRTYADRRDALLKAVVKRRKKLKLLAIEYKGGKCHVCGYNRFAGALELHHVNKAEKSFGIGDKGYTRAWIKIKAELDKCVLLCANCHREVSGGITQLSAERRIEKRGEFGEILKKQNSWMRVQKDNPEPSPSHVKENF